VQHNKTQNKKEVNKSKKEVNKSNGWTPEANLKEVFKRFLKSVPSETTRRTPELWDPAHGQVHP